MNRCGLYIHSQAFATSKNPNEIAWVGHAWPHFKRVRDELARNIDQATVTHLPLRQVELTEFRSVHSSDYLDKIEQMANGRYPEQMPRLSAECKGLEHCLPGYRYGLGGMYEAVEQMKRGELDRAYVCALGGHHAFRDWGHGYCLLNSQAAAAKYAQTQSFQNILIVDWDIHHGDGTQQIFAGDPSIHCLSIHSGLDLYMMTQRVHQFGTEQAGALAGHQNIPLLSTHFAKENFARFGNLYYPDEIVKQFELAIENLPWSPDLIMLFSGYDGHVEDCGKFITNWTNQDFRWLTRRMIQLADKEQAPILSVHGGGYKLPVTVSATLAHLDELGCLI